MLVSPRGMLKKFAALAVGATLLSACAPAATEAPATAATTTQITTTETITTTILPAGEWPGVPEAYWPLLDRYNYNYIPYYALVDINGDGIPELLLAFLYIYPELRPYRMFTLIDGEAVNVACFGHRGITRFTADGTIYRSGGRGRHRWLTSWRLEPGATELTRLTEWDAEYDEDFSQRSYFSGIGDNRQPIAASEFYAARERYINPPNLMQLNFVPLYPFY